MKHIILLIVCFALVLLSGGQNENSENSNLSLNLLKNEINELRRQMKEVDSRVWHLENDENVIFSAYKNQNDGTSVITAGQYLEGFNGFFTNFGSGFMLDYGIFTAEGKEFMSFLYLHYMMCYMVVPQFLQFIKMGLKYCHCIQGTRIVRLL